MNDNDPDRRLLIALQNLNIGANGRWFILALVAIAIAAGQLKFAVILACTLGLSVILEQVAAPWRGMVAYALYAWAAIMAIVLLVIV